MAFSHATFGLRLKRGDRQPRWWALALGAMSCAALKMAAAPMPAIAQSISALPACAAPGPEEYLLLVVLQTEAAQNKLVETLPPSVSAPTCNYLGSRVARMGGFEKPEDADAWASYLRDAAALPAFVAKPTQSSGTSAAAVTPPVAVNTAIQDPATFSPSVQPAVQSRSAASQTAAAPASAQRISPPLDVLPPPVMPTQSSIDNRVDVPSPREGAIASPTPAAPATIAQAPTAPTASPSSATPAVRPYEPKRLASDYAVLVDYGNQTSLVPLIRQLTKRSVGLASYGQRPFLLVNHTSDSDAALTTLKTLNKSGFRTMLVDGGQVTLLTSDAQVN